MQENNEDLNQTSESLQGSTLQQPNPTSPTDEKLQTPTQNTSSNNKAKFSVKIIVSIVIFLLLTGGAAASFTVFRPQIEKFIMKPTPTSTPKFTKALTPTSDPTANWKTYQGNDFTVKYPPYLSVRTGSLVKEVTFRSPDLKFENEAIKSGYMYSLIVDQSEMVITIPDKTAATTSWLGRKAYLSVGKGGNSYADLLVNDKLPYLNLDMLMPATTNSTALFEKNKDIFFGIANSLKLQPETPTPNPTTNWKTFNNGKYSFEYPSNFYIYDFKDSNSSIDISDIPDPQDIPLKISSNNHTIIEVSFNSGKMPLCFPYTNGGISCTNPTIKPYTSPNGYTGIRGNETEDSTVLSDVVLLQKDVNSYAQITYQNGDKTVFNQILQTFKFIN